MKRIVTAGAVAVLLCLNLCIAGCTPKKSPSGPPSKLKTQPVDLSKLPDGKLSFTKYYTREPLDITLKIPGYSLPLKKEKVKNFKDVGQKLPLSAEALAVLERTGFVVVDDPFNPKEEYFEQAYEALKDREIPVFITSDSLLHVYHIQFDETLRQIEEKEFYADIWEISRQLLDSSVALHEQASGDLKEAARKNVVYFAVGLGLLAPGKEQACDAEPYRCNDPGIAGAYFSDEEMKKYSFAVPAFAKEAVDKELKLIAGHQGFSASPTFTYVEDYSQYVPRGHYTRSEKLKNYFKALMWYGRISMLLKGSSDKEPGGMITAEEARLQTMQAALITSAFAGTAGIKEAWERMYAVTAFYVGLSDDLGPYEYLDAMRFVFGSSFDPGKLSAETVGKMKAKLAEFRSPKIYGGTGGCVLLPPFSPEQANQCLEDTKGFRLMGQRFIPDSYMFTNLVSPAAGHFTEKDCGGTFTCAMTDDGPWRVFPRGLDVMALLGSKRAPAVLRGMDDTSYGGYAAAYEKLEKEFAGFGEAEWNRNLYWSWLYALKPLLQEFPEGYQAFMRTEAWQDKELSTALASWTELRHDTILYAKQSYTVGTTSVHIPPPEKPVVGYIEPVPEFYGRLLALTKMTIKGLGDMKVLDGPALARLGALEKILRKLTDLSSKELDNKELEKEDYDFIKNFSDSLDEVIADVESRAKRTAIVADVHTDTNTGSVLEEGVGCVRLMVAAYVLPDGRILLGAGPVFSSYEFKHPMSDRLTDEKWQAMLASAPPPLPPWISSFSR